MRILHATSPAETAAIEVLEAAAGGRVVVLRVDDAPANDRPKAHRLRTAVSRARATVTSLKKGYRFDDEAAPRLIELLEQGVEALEADIEAWAAIYGSQDDQAGR